jgi:hypothetical protein
MGALSMCHEGAATLLQPPVFDMAYITGCPRSLSIRLRLTERPPMCRRAEHSCLRMLDNVTGLGELLGNSQTTDTTTNIGAATEM